MNLIEKKKLLKQFQAIQSANDQFIEFVNTHLKSEHNYNRSDRDSLKRLISHLTNMNLVFARMEDGFRKQKG